MWDAIGTLIALTLCPLQNVHDKALHAWMDLLRVPGGQQDSPG